MARNHNDFSTEKSTIMLVIRLLLAAVLAGILLAAAIFMLPYFSPHSFLSEILPRQASGYRNHIPSSASHIPEISLSFDVQGHNQCAGYVTAFIRRYYGDEVYGSEVYREISYNSPVDIGVPPHRIMRNFEENSLNASARTGDLEHIKHYAAREIPVIVLVGQGISWQHYMVLIGFDSEKSELYFYDSEVSSFDRSRSDPGNRTMSEEKFLKIWQNRLPVFSQLFITVEPPPASDVT